MRALVFALFVSFLALPALAQNTGTQGGGGGGGGGAPSGPAGGDLSGTYPNPTVTTMTHGTSAITTNLNAAAAVAPPTGTTVHITQADATASEVVLDTAGSGATPEILGRRSGGTIGTPTALTGVDALLISGGGYDGSAWSGRQAYISFTSGGTWSGSSHPMQIGFNVTASNSTTVATAFTIDPSGHAYFSSQTALHNSPTCGTGCASISSGSSDNSFSFTTGSAATVEVLNFGTSWSGTTFTGCTLTAQGSTPVALSYIPNGTPVASIVVYNAALTSVVITGHCF